MSSGQVKEWVSDAGMECEYVAKLGDERRNQRARRVGTAVASKPELSLTKVFTDEADLEAAYRLLRNPAVAWRDLAAAHLGRTLERAAQTGEVLVAHDTTDLAFRMYWPDERRGQTSSFSSRTQGFFLHTSLAITAQGRALPLGVVDLQPFVHQSGISESDTQTREFWENEAGLFDNEQARWCRSVAITHDELAKHGLDPVHVMDCETDSYGLLSWLVQDDHRFVLRCDGTRKLKHGGEMRDIGVVTVNLGERFALRSGSKVDSHPPRRARTVQLTVRAGMVTLTRTQKAKDASWSPSGFAHQPKTLDLHLVEAVETNPPAGEKAVRWLLLTTEPIDTTDDVLRIVEWYRRRWPIEEYFKALKTGCKLENRQMESSATMLRWHCSSRRRGDCCSCARSRAKTRARSGNTFWRRWNIGSSAAQCPRPTSGGCDHRTMRRRHRQAWWALTTQRSSGLADATR
jgi:hypothetical protein